MRRALDEVQVSGIQTTLPFDRALVRDPGFVDGADISTDWVPSHWDGAADKAARREIAARAAATAVADRVARLVVSLRKDDRATAWRTAGLEAAIERWPR